MTQVPASEPMADRLAQAILSTTGPNGRIVINYNCTSLPPCSGVGNVYQYTDSEGYTVIRFTGACEWSAPEGLDEFELLVVGGGGGGGYGEAAGGGGGGAVIYQQYLGITMNGFPGLQGAQFQITPGGQGLGASANTMKGENGNDSFFTGPSFDHSAGNTFTNISAAGGGGGGSSNASSSIRLGENGASGGGGAAYSSDESNGGTADNGNSGGNGIGESSGSAGAGGGGASTSGADGNLGSGTASAGSGGNGEARTISGEEIFYGAGGGGTASGAITNQAGFGGSLYNGANGNQFRSGGNGNNNGVGQPATTYGSGGGAGRLGGSAGFQGVVYIRYPNFRILPIEYLYFNAIYNSALRSGDLFWSTVKEWENDRFEIERSVNDVKSWENIDKIAGAGYSDTPVAYSYQDLTLPLAGGTIFYRLKQIDFDGDSTYSDTKSIQIDPLPGITRWRVFPNPTTGDPFNIEVLDLSTYNDEPITLRVIAASGQFKTFQVSDMSNMGMQVSQYFTHMAAGIYTIEISWGIHKEYHKVILKR